MAIWRSAVLTRAGNELLVNAAAGKQIVFTRLVTGCGIYTEEEKDRAALANATALKQQVQEFSFSLYEKQSEQSVLLKALISNKELTESYTMTEVGVYGKEVGAETDVLCSITVTNSLEESDLFAPYNGLKPDQIVMEYYITLSPDAEVTVNMQGAAALAEDLQALKEQVEQSIQIVMEGKTNIVGTGVEIPEENREKNTFYLTIKKSGAIIPENGVIMASPYLGYKIIQEGEE